ncbi:LysR family transcriptional regulator [Pseudomonas sp. KNUC1026]|uniref:LysR family transcriptional regulator n=1 Tax=Pseudomonas sp. KNUC1026 TaxID=2893890 RepID=UPI001F42240C|nr:LysR family transcriptional regulator [Pseudomonas sp. KNUC1026]UFH48156.1 LysR family transcriptional regulator [Pseudomonas sp. KNUC1026]
MDMLNLINTFIRVVEAGSIAAAARAQGVSPAAVSQSLAKLEAHLGVRLLSRTTRHMALTESGARYYDQAQHIPNAVALAAQAAGAQSLPQGRLCVASTAAFGRHVLAPLMPAFAERYPGIAVELIGTDRRVDHRLEGVDLSLRIGAQLSEQLIALPLATRPFVFCAAPAYLARAGTPVTLVDLQQHACLAFRYPTDGRFLPWGFMQNGKRVEARINPAFICDDVDMIAQIAANGGGIARLASFVAEPDLRRGELVTLFDGTEQPEPMQIYACVSDRSALNARVRALIGFLQERLGVDQPT